MIKQSDLEIVDKYHTFFMKKIKEGFGPDRAVKLWQKHQKEQLKARKKNG